MSKRRAAWLGTMFALGTLLGARGCGDVTNDRVAAREKAVKAICDRFTQCELIGPDADDSYMTREACTIDQRAGRDDAWLSADCTGHINDAELNVCLAAVAATNCMGWDFVGTLLKCTSTTVCSKGKTPDGGG